MTCSHTHMFATCLITCTGLLKRYQFTGCDMALQKSSGVAILVSLQECGFFQPRTVHRETNSEKPQIKIRFAFHFVERNNDQNKNVALECKEFVRYLGVIIDNNLSWKHHIDHVAIKISRTVGLICKLRHFLPKHTLLTIYRFLVTPYLTHGWMAWRQAYKSHLEKLLKLQKRALR